MNLDIKFNGEMKKEYKSSQFNEYLGRGKEGWVIFNNLSSAMIEVPKRIYDAISKDRLDILSDDVLFGLKKGHFIVSDNDNEIDILKKKREELYESSAVIGLQILPTLGCNFRCIYCYENSQSNTKLMSKEVMDAIINYVKKTIKSTTRYIYVSWYGGEPLLAMKRIEYLSNSFVDISDKNNIEYFSHITTNGYLLTAKNLEKLRKFRINHLQITIDGPEDIHNKRRMLKNGKGTYKKIVENLKNAILCKMDITVRVNIDRGNIYNLKELFLDLQKYDILQNVKMSLGLVGNFGKVCRSVEDELLTFKEATNILKSCSLKKFLLKSKNSNYGRRPFPNLLGCIAQSKISLIVGPRGEIYKCSKTIGNEEEICGTIFNVNTEHPNFQKWMNKDKLEVEQCLECSMLPICGGNGCPYDVIFLNKHNKCFQKERHNFYLNTLKKLYQQNICKIKGSEPLKINDRKGGD
jgi:uncharacterized protein